MNYVFVLDTNQQPLNPIHPGWARKLLSSGRAAVYRRYPFTIILKWVAVLSQSETFRAVPEPVSQGLRLKIDPGSKTTGIALVNDETGEVVWAAELQHRGWQIKSALDSRRGIRRSRRHRKTRYRKPRFNNRRRPKGWLPPSLMSRVYNIETWIARLRRYCPIMAISLELAKFDMQKMQNPEISGVEYRQGELHGYEVREYLLEKFGRKCVYCEKNNVPLQVEHIIPKSRGGSDRVTNLTIACPKCNQCKSNQTAEEFGHPEVQAQAKKPLKVAVLSRCSARETFRDAAAVNATRWEIYRRLQATGLPIELGTGGRTKFNRVRHGLPKAHWLDAACVGASTPEMLNVEGVRPLTIIATGHGNRQMCGTNKYGFPIRHRTGQKQFFGFETGDIVTAVVPKGKRAGTHVGRVMVRATGSFDIRTKSGRVQGINQKYCQIIQRSDGYNYQAGAPIPLHG